MWSFISRSLWLQDPSGTKLRRLLPWSPRGNATRHACTQGESSQNHLLCWCRSCSLQDDQKIHYWSSLIHQQHACQVDFQEKTTVETSTYGSEMVAARIAVELVMEICYALRMLGVPINEPALLLGDNQSVVLNTTVPASVLKKKHNAVCYHRIREACAASIIRFCHIPSHDNIADICTKSLGKATFYTLMKQVFHRLPKCFNDGRTREQDEQKDTNERL